MTNKASQARSHLLGLERMASDYLESRKHITGRSMIYGVIASPERHRMASRLHVELQKNDIFSDSSLFSSFSRDVLFQLQASAIFVGHYVRLFQRFFFSLDIKRGATELLESCSPPFMGRTFVAPEIGCARDAMRFTLPLLQGMQGIRR